MRRTCIFSFRYACYVAKSGEDNRRKTGKHAEKDDFQSPETLALGAGITIAVQSSSALTVMLVGLVNSGIMQLEQTVGVIMGSNIGTTLTAWLLSTAGIKSDNLIIAMLKPDHFAPVVALIGIAMLMISKNKKKKSRLADST